MHLTGEMVVVGVVVSGLLAFDHYLISSIVFKYVGWYGEVHLSICLHGLESCYQLYVLSKTSASILPLKAF